MGFRRRRLTTPSAPPLPAGLLTTVTRFAVLAGALSVVAPYFVGLTATLGAIAVVLWAVLRRASRPAAPGWPGWVAGAAVASVGWSTTLGVHGAGSVVRGPTLAAMTVVLWALARRSEAARGPL